MTSISRFCGQYAFLSNFFVEPDGTHVEGEFQSAKCWRKKDKDAFKTLIASPRGTPVECKRMGRRIELRPNWDAIRVDIMWDLVRKKFIDHPSLAAKLRATGSHLLIEDNTWGDRFWGQVDNIGENWLGRILMDVRDNLL